MNFWLYVFCMYCVLSAGDLSRHVTANHIGLLPTSKPVRTTFFTLTAPAMFGVFALPIYGFFVMLWWQPIVGFLLAAILASLLTRRLLAASHWLYVWAIVFSLGATIIFLYSVFKG